MIMRENTQRESRIEICKKVVFIYREHLNKDDELFLHHAHNLHPGFCRPCLDGIATDDEE
jgi:hypothetical protein